MFHHTHPVANTRHKQDTITNTHGNAAGKLQHAFQLLCRQSKEHVQGMVADTSRANIQAPCTLGMAISASYNTFGLEDEQSLSPDMTCCLRYMHQPVNPLRETLLLQIRYME